MHEINRREHTAMTVTYRTNLIDDMRAAAIRCARYWAKDSTPQTISACKRAVEISIYYQDRCTLDSPDWHWHDAFIAELGDWLMLHTAS